MKKNINIKLPSGDIKSYTYKITPFDIAEEISISLKKNAIISKVNNQLWDLGRLIDFDCDLEIITKGNKELLEVLRHDAAHVMAEAVLELYPDAKITIEIITTLHIWNNVSFLEKIWFIEITARTISICANSIPKAKGNKVSVELLDWKMNPKYLPNPNPWMIP